MIAMDLVQHRARYTRDSKSAEQIDRIFQLSDEAISAAGDENLRLDEILSIIDLVNFYQHRSTSSSLIR